MNNKFIIAILFVLLFSLSLYSQDYYWYNNNRINIEIDNTKLNVTTLIEVDLSSVLREFSVSEVKQIERTKNNTLLFSVDLHSTELYGRIVNYLKLIDGIVSVSPYFKRGENNSIGTSSFFYIKLHKEEDYELLAEFATQNNIKIVEQFKYMPLCEKFWLPEGGKFFNNNIYNTPLLVV